jgi:protein TonB
MNAITRVLAASTLSLLLIPASYAAGTANAIEDCPLPDYLSTWVRSDMQGSVTIAYTTDASGKIIDPTLLQSSGYRSLDEASLKAIALCKVAAVASDHPQPVTGKVRYVWQINQ